MLCRILLLLLCCLAICACRETPPPIVGEPVRLGVPRGPYAFLVDLARAQGFFAAHGLQVEVREYDSGYDAVREVGKGLDLACAPEYAFVIEAEENPELRIVASIAESDFHELVARRDLAISDIADLRGRTVGVTANTAGEFFLGSFLVFEGAISAAEVRTVDLPQAALVEALQRGKVAAAVLGGTELLEAKRRLGGRLVAWPAQWGLGFFWCLVTDVPHLAAGPERLERVLRALLQAEEYLRRHPQAGRELLRRQYDLGAAEVETVLERIDFYVTLNQSLIVAMEEEAEWVKLGPVPNYLRRIAFDPLQTVAPARVTVFR